MIAMTQAYVECALWSTNDESTPEGGEPLDQNYCIEDIDAKTLSEMDSDCAEFLEVNRDDIGDDLEQAGHDFWLTRNGHGAGFWDGDWPEPAATRLTKASKAFGECHLYVGEADLIYAM